jgi:hypothetical protein
MALCIQELQASLQKGEVVVYAYCDWNNRRLQTAANLFGSLARQLVENLDTFPPAVADAYRSHKHGRTSMTWEEQVELLEGLGDCFDRVFIVFDALDECREDDGVLPKMTVIETALNTLINESTRLLVSSRLSPTYESVGYQVLEVTAKSKDIEHFISTELTRDSSGHWANVRLQAELKRNGPLLDTVIRSCTAQAGDL